jgi:outer membrane protein assembly factor BamB
LLFNAPQDCDKVFALDATTGHPLWVTDRAVDAVHLLGVGSDRLIASGDCLYWLDIYTGESRGRYPNPTKPVPGHARPTPRGYGRGALVGSQIYWPTREAIYVFQQNTVRGPRFWEPLLDRAIPLGPRGVTGGNLVISDGVLLLATADHLYAFDETGTPEHARGP